MTYPSRPPDLDLPTFRIWKEKKEDIDTSKSEAAIVLEGDKGELVHESRNYNHSTTGYSMLILSKIREDRIWMIIRGKREDGSPFMDSRPGKWLTMSEYEDEVKEVEELILGLGFDIESPMITSGKAFNVYMGK